MQGGWQPPPGGGGGYGGPPGYGAPPPGGPSGYGPPAGGGYPPGGGGYPPGGGGYPQQNPYAAPGPGTGMMNPQYGNYEFNEYENSVIDKAASRMKLWGTISLVVGILQILGSCGMFANPSLATYLPAGIVAIVVGVTFMGAGTSLKSVVTTQGSDLQYLMQAMQKMSSAFMIQIVCALVGFALAVLGVILVMFVFAVVAASR